MKSHTCRILLSCLLLCFLCSINYAQQLDRLKNRLQRTDDVAEKFDILCGIQNLYWKQYEPDSVRAYGHLILQEDSIHSNLTLDQKVEALLLNARASSTSEALPKVHQILDLATNNNYQNDSLQAQLFAQYANALIVHDSIPKGIEYIKKSIVLAEKVNHKAVLAYTYSMLSFFEKEKAIDFQRKSHQFYKAVQESSGTFIRGLGSMNASNLGQAYSLSGFPDSAMMVFQDAYNMSKPIPINDYSAIFHTSTLSTLSKEYAKLGYKDLAMQYAKEGYQRLQLHPLNYFNHVHALNDLGDLYKDQLNQAQNAKPYYLEAISYDPSNSIHKDSLAKLERSVLERSYYALYEIDKERDPANALAYLEQYTELHKENYEKESKVAVEKLKKELSFEKERAAFEKAQLEQAAKLKQRQLYIGILMLSLLSTLFIVGIIYRNGKRTSALNAKLTTSNEKLTKKNAQLNRYAHSISHDVLSKLKLIVIAGNSLIENRNTSLTNYQNYYQESRSAAKWLRQYCVDLLAWAKEEEHEIITSTSLKEIVQDILQSYQKLLEQYHVKVETKDLDQLVNIPAAPLKQIVQNLVDNGIKFSKNQTQPVIKIQAVQRGEKVKLSVEDNGIGLPPDLEGNLLSNTRLQEEVASKGLAIVGSIVKQYNGSFTGEKREQVGARMSVEI